MEFERSQESCLTGLIESGNRASKKESRRPTKPTRGDLEPAKKNLIVANKIPQDGILPAP